MEDGSWPTYLASNGWLGNAQFLIKGTYIIVFSYKFFF